MRSLRTRGSHDGEPVADEQEQEVREDEQQPEKRSQVFADIDAKYDRFSEDDFNLGVTVRRRERRYYDD